MIEKRCYIQWLSHFLFLGLPFRLAEYIRGRGSLRIPSGISTSRPEKKKISGLGSSQGAFIVLKLLRHQPVTESKMHHLIC
ncbi:hypothetical protein BDV36DRAFT_101232 [Aspergillus pseudocaelatus]|uniref:Uncharacterized protein n=1 Tax=Aspergillus pseudocaelatus TaxID=1825620 RepID=A0ABQ6W1Q4_9EURO|nr:hypothetical protein BDV36DRAFT_101232 [Aspergillus pseudocaelatus]